VRLPNGRSKKYSLYLKDYTPDKEYDEMPNCKRELEENIKNDLLNIYSEYYKKSVIYNANLIKRLEEIRLEYKDVIKKFTKKQFQSNAIEGNSLTLKDVTMIFHEKKMSKNKDLREIYETINTRDAVELIFENKLKVNKDHIIKLHQILTKNTGIPFGYKRIPNFLLGRNVETTPPEKVDIEMNNLIKWYHENQDMHPLERATIFHGMFEKIHPFEDGNGRVGRLLINIILINNGYPPLIIRKTQRLAYFGALEAFDNGHKDKLKRFIIEKYKNTHEKFFKIYVKYLKEV